MRRPGERGVPPRPSPERERDDHDAAQCQDFGGRHDVLDPTPRRHADHVDSREQRHEPGGERRGARRRPREKSRQELSPGHADGGDRGAVHPHALDPPHDERRPPAERFPREHVLATGARMPRGELREAQRAEQRDHAAQHPSHEGEPGPAESRGHDPRSAEDPGADRDPHDHRQPVAEAERALEVGHASGGGMCTENERGAAGCAPHDSQP